MLDINLVYMSKEKFGAVRKRNEYSVKAPGEYERYKEGIPMQDKVRELKVN